MIKTAVEGAGSITLLEAIHTIDHPTSSSVEEIVKLSLQVIIGILSIIRMSREIQRTSPRKRRKQGKDTPEQ